MNNFLRRTATLMSTLALSLGVVGCAVTPPSIVQVPTTVRPQPAAATAPANGAIFQTASYRPTFEDRRARHVGDILVISIVEKTSAQKSAANSGGKSGSAEIAVPSLFGVPTTTVAKLGMSASGDTNFDEKGATTASNSFTGTIAATVVDVLPNGNLLVSGEKQIAFDKGAEYVRFSGVVNPDTIVSGNMVSSTQVADARVEYRSNSRLDRADVMSMLTRYFLSFVPL